MAISRLLLTKVTCLKFCRRLAKTLRSQPQVVYALYAMAERISTALYTFSNRSKNIRLAIEGDWDKIDCSPFGRACKAFLEDVRKIDDFIDGTILPENDASTRRLRNTFYMTGQIGRASCHVECGST